MFIPLNNPLEAEALILLLGALGKPGVTFNGLGLIIDDPVLYQQALAITAAPNWFQDEGEGAVEEQEQQSADLDLSGLVSRLEILERPPVIMEWPVNESSVKRLTWHTISVPGELVIPPELAGVWVWAIYYRAPNNGRPIAAQILKNDEPFMSQSMDGSGRLGDTTTTLTSVIRVSPGDRVCAQVNHDAGYTSNISGFIAAMKIS